MKTKKILFIKISLILFLITIFNKSFASITFDQLASGIQISPKEFNQTKKKFLNTYTKNKEPFAYPITKKIVSPASKIAIHADFHGDKKATFNYINKLSQDGYLSKKNKFKIEQKDFYMIFTGDFVDRGPDGLEVLYTTMRLRIENPNNVQILRGNHEEISANIACGFFEELKRKNFIHDKINSETELKNLVEPIYNALPAALYLGVTDKNSQNKNFTNYIMFVHAGIEPRFNPKHLLASNKKNETIYLSSLYIK